jgi:hypothetical protein
MSGGTEQLLVEITRVGGWRRVAVLDPATGEEAVVHGPVDAAEEGLVKLARRKLRRPRRRVVEPRGPGFLA